MLRISKIVILGLLVLLNPVQATEQTPSTVVDLSTLMGLEQLLPALAGKRLVFVGETHNRYDHHLNQLAIIRNQHAQNHQLAIGVEFIQQPFQSVLDDYISGKITEAAMLEQTEYFNRWRYDYRLYRPIFNYAHENGIPLIALNIASEITDKVKAEGVESLTEEQKNQLPGEISREDTEYRERLKEIFKQHPNATDSEFDSFMEIQLLWDESMAERAADWLRDNPAGNMVVLAGSGHIMYGSGIPDRVQRRIEVAASRVINLGETAALTPDLGDFVIMSEKQELPPSGKLGAILDATVSPPKIIGFAPGSGAQKAGLKEKDAVTAIAGKPVVTYADIRIALLDKEVDEVVMVEVSRKHFFGGRKTQQFEVMLK